MKTLIQNHWLTIVIICCMGIAISILFMCYYGFKKEVDFQKAILSYGIISIFYILATIVLAAAKHILK